MQIRTVALVLALVACAVRTPAASAAHETLPAGTVAAVPRVPFRDLGGAPRIPVRLAVILTYRNESELRALTSGRWGSSPQPPVLSENQFVNYFSPSAADYEQAAATFMHMGFHVVKTYANRTVIDVEAPAEVVDRAFSTDIHAVVQRAVGAQDGRAGIPGGLRYANLRPAILPAELRPSVYGILGFDNLRLVRPAYVLERSGISTGVTIGPPLRGPDGGFGPLAFTNGYNFPVQHQVRGGKVGQTYDGTGQATANVMDSDFADSDLAAFLSYFNIVRSGPATRRILIDGGPNPRINADQIETDLDVETIVGTTPGTALYLYLFPQNTGNAGIIDTYNQIISDDAVDAVNSSFTVCEDVARSYALTTDHIAMQGVALGINFSAATGDDGSACPGGQGVGAPASGPHFVATGGTTLFVYPDGSYASESGWGGSGGGVSDVFAKPAYQNAIQNIVGNTRNLPDIAFDADPRTGTSLYMNGRFAGPVGGTSLASPLTTALITQLDQFNGSRFGDVHPRIYGEFRKLGYGTFDRLPAFRDIIAGSNGMYQCTRGYDLVTGIGSIDGAGAANAYKPG